MAYALDYLAVVIHLPQLALGIEFVATVNHEIIHYHAEARTDTKCIFYELMGLHETPFTSTKSGDYM
jgi:hypothetical protein